MTGQCPADAAEHGEGGTDAQAPAQTVLPTVLREIKDALRAGSKPPCPP